MLQYIQHWITWVDFLLNVYNAGAVYKYTKEYAVSIRDLASFVCTDNKHKILVGEPGFPIAALPRGRRLLIMTSQIYH